MGHLCIAIPTRNRASLLDGTLQALLDEIVRAGRDASDRVVVAISNNASTDNTDEVAAGWKKRFADAGVACRTSTAAEMLPLNVSVRRAVHMSEETWTWMMGDDDELVPGVLQYVLRTLDERPDLALLLLNHSGRELGSNELRVEDYLTGPADSGTQDGREVFARQLDYSFDGIIFIGAPVYRTTLLHAAYRAWPEALDNFAVSAWTAGYAAAHGPLKVSKERWLVNILGRSQWAQNPHRALRLTYFEFPELLLRFENVGYSREFVRTSIRVMCRRFNVRLIGLRQHARALRDRPRFPLKFLRTLMR